MKISKQFNLFCRLDNFTPEMREEKRLTALKKLGLLEEKVVPVFDEATQTVANFLEAPICILGVMIGEEFCLKSVVGLSKLGLMNEIATARKIPRNEALSTYVIDSQNNLLIENTLTDSFFSRSNLVQHYGIRAYLGTPLITAYGDCIGSLEVIELSPRQFSQKDIEFLAITARWCLSEYERSQLSLEKSIPDNRSQPNINLSGSPKKSRISLGQKPYNYSHELKVKLLHKLSQELRTPLTSVIGMASVLKGEFYGHLSTKQKEYLEIIYRSGQDMTSLVEEIISLGNLEEINSLQLISVDLEMLSQQVIRSLDSLAKKQEHSLLLSIEPGNRIWSLDKQKVKQTLYYLLITIIESCRPGGEISIHISHRSSKINISIWVRHPWLGEGIPFEKVDLYSQIVAQFERDESEIKPDIIAQTLSGQNEHGLDTHETLGLLFSCYLAQLQGGKISFQGSPETGYRFVFSLPIIES
jgi:signal transduction histidine kinase